MSRIAVRSQQTQNRADAIGDRLPLDGQSGSIGIHVVNYVVLVTFDGAVATTIPKLIPVMLHDHRSIVLNCVGREIVEPKWMPFRSVDQDRDQCLQWAGNAHSKSSTS